MKRSNYYASLVLVVLLSLLSCNAIAATVDGIPLHSSSTGNGSKTVIFVHGWTCDDTTWESQVPAVSKDYRVITIDLPGHGQSGSPKDGHFSMDLFARAVEAVRAEAKAEKVVLVGHSMGTPVVIQYARLYPQHTAGLVFVDGLIRVNGISVNEQQFAGPDGKKARETMIRGMFSPATTPAMQTHVLSMMLGAPEATATGAMKAMFQTFKSSDEVMKMPVLGIYADHSRAGGERDYMTKVYPNLNYVEIPATGHFLMLEKPDEFNRLLLDFLRKQSF
jgi:pimeloyl-ACP methyl ester carboxylesterase